MRSANIIGRTIIECAEMNIKKLILVSLLFLSPQANAIPVSAGSEFDVDWFVDLDDGLTSSDLTATSIWTVSSYSSSTIVLDISIFNTTILDPGSLDNAAITAFGFGVSPDATAVLSSAGSVFDMVGEGSGPQQNFPGGFKGIDVCLFADGCAGGNVNNGLQAGDSDSLQVTISALTGTSFGDTTDLLFFPAKFQTSLGSYEPAGCVDGNNCTSVPEPGLAALMAIGLTGIAVAARRRERT